MDFVSTSLITLNQPKGMWEAILNAFKGGLGSYMYAVILIAVLVRIVFSLVDIINKKVTMKNSGLMAKMKPELDAIQKKYGYDQKLMSQKQNEIYRKYQFNMMSTCLPMLITMALQFTVFLTLWTSLQNVANYNIVKKYEDMKNIYANVVALNEETVTFTDGDEINIEVNANKIVFVNETQNTTEEFEIQNDFTNEAVYNMIHKYVDEGTTENPNTEYVGTALSKKLVTIAQNMAEENYLENQEGFLWIKNIYKAESPTSPLFTEKEVKNYLSKFYSKEEKALEKEKDYEGKIFNFVVTNGIGQKKLGSNGYYILTILAVVVSFLSIWLSNKLMKGVGTAQNQSKIMYIIMPVLMGIFTFMYTSLFAVYIIVGQLMMMVLTPLTTIIVKKWIAHDAAKQKEKTEVVVDYRRKDM